MDGLPPNFDIYLAPSRPTIECVVSESHNYGIPPLVTLAIMKTENGKPGSIVRNKNQTSDLGVMQINDIHIPGYAKKTGLSENVTKHLLVQNGCFSVSVALDILDGHFKRTGSLTKAVAAYHSKTPSVGAKYLEKVEGNLQRIQLGALPPVLKISASQR